MQQSIEILKGRIERLYFAGPSFSAGRVQTSSGESIPFSGRFFAQEGTHLSMRGSMGRHPKFGMQFQATSIEHDLALDKTGLVSYLANNPELKGIGPAKAQKIVELFGDRFERTLLDHPEEIVKAVGLEPTITRLREQWLRNKNENAVMAWLSAFGLTHHQVTTLVEKFGGNALEILRGDPYILVQEIRGFGFKKVDQIARKMGTPKESPQRIQAGITWLLREALDNGHCYTEMAVLIDEANELLVMDCLDSRKRIAAELDVLGKAGTVAGKVVDGQVRIALPFIIRQEDELAGMLQQAGNPHPHRINADCPDPDLSREQRKALDMALRHSICCISGGAGSGKSYTIARLVETLTEAGLRTALAAPTGKAAKRMEECLRATGKESIRHLTASTLHRLLGYDGRKFARDEQNRLDCQVLIVDEVSMVDITLAWHLFQAIDLDRTAVVLVGDHNQLPPVGPGNVLRDILQTKVVPRVVLEKVHRQAGALKENSIAVLSGVVRPTSAPEIGRCRAWYLANNLAEPDDVRNMLFQTITGQLGPFGFDIVRDVQVLTPTHKGPIGTRELNIALQAVIQKHAYGVFVPPTPPNRRPSLLLHDKVIQTRNNYDLGVMNGAIGIVTQADGDVVVDFDGVPMTYERGSQDLQDVQLAYALTVHKVQGSEFRCAVVIVHKSHSFMHHRNLLYTAVTRAKDTCIILGDHWGIRHCAEQCKVEARRTTFEHFLAAGGKA
jgi:exodeoxyribonuclease V alpha subunit